MRTSKEVPGMTRSRARRLLGAFAFALKIRKAG
jgi:hypothetical protein